MSRPREARSVAIRMVVRPERKARRARRELEAEAVDRVKVDVRGPMVGERRVRRRESRSAEAVERVKTRARG